MLVKGWMTSDVLTIDEDTSMMKASEIMRENNIRRLPVMHKGKLVGIVTDRDIKEASPSKATTLDVHELYYLLSELKIKDIMSTHVFTISPEEDRGEGGGEDAGAPYIRTTGGQRQREGGRADNPVGYF